GDQLGGYGDLALVLHFAWHPRADPYLEIGGGQLETRILGLEQNVGQDWQRGSTAHRPAHGLEPPREVLLHHRDVHDDLTLTSPQHSGRRPLNYESEGMKEGYPSWSLVGVWTVWKVVVPAHVSGSGPCRPMGGAMW